MNKKGEVGDPVDSGKVEGIKAFEIPSSSRAERRLRPRRISLSIETQGIVGGLCSGPKSKMAIDDQFLSPFNPISTSSEYRIYVEEDDSDADSSYE